MPYSSPQPEPAKYEGYVNISTSVGPGIDIIFTIRPYDDIMVGGPLSDADALVQHVLDHLADMPPFAGTLTGSTLQSAAVRKIYQTSQEGTPTP